jgi:hypothetical protein
MSTLAAGRKRRREWSTKQKKKAADPSNVWQTTMPAGSNTEGQLSVTESFGPSDLWTFNNHCQAIVHTSSLSAEWLLQPTEFGGNIMEA